MAVPVCGASRMLREWKGDTEEGEMKRRLLFRKRPGGGGRLGGVGGRGVGAHRTTVMDSDVEVGDLRE
jgi:hypothetical protein